jgi:hypothetical protein
MMGVVLAGCAHSQENIGLMTKYVVPEIEAEWIRNGDPIEFEGQFWYPQDRYDILLDSEVFFLGKYRGVDFFIEKIDVRPYDKLFTKFGRNKFRIYRLLD